MLPRSYKSTPSGKDRVLESRSSRPRTAASRPKKAWLPGEREGQTGVTSQSVVTSRGAFSLVSSRIHRNEENGQSFSGLRSNEVERRVCFHVEEKEGNNVTLSLMDTEKKESTRCRGNAVTCVKKLQQIKRTSSPRDVPDPTMPLTISSYLSSCTRNDTDEMLSSTRNVVAPQDGDKCSHRLIANPKNLAIPRHKNCRTLLGYPSAAFQKDYLPFLTRNFESEEAVQSKYDSSITTDKEDKRSFAMTPISSNLVLENTTDTPTDAPDPSGTDVFPQHSLSYQANLYLSYHQQQRVNTLNEWRAYFFTELPELGIQGVYTQCLLAHRSAWNATPKAFVGAYDSSFRYRITVAAVLLWSLIHSDCMERMPLVRDLVCDLLPGIFVSAPVYSSSKNDGLNIDPFLEKVQQCLDNPTSGTQFSPLQFFDTIVELNVHACAQSTLVEAEHVKQRIAMFALEKKVRKLKKSSFDAWRAYARQCNHRRALKQLVLRQVDLRTMLYMRWAMACLRAAVPSRGTRTEYRRKQRRVRRRQNRQKMKEHAMYQLVTCSLNPIDRLTSWVEEIGSSIPAKLHRTNQFWCTLDTSERTRWRFPQVAPINGASGVSIPVPAGTPLLATSSQSSGRWLDMNSSSEESSDQGSSIMHCPGEDFLLALDFFFTKREDCNAAAAPNFFSGQPGVSTDCVLQQKKKKCISIATYLQHLFGDSLMRQHVTYSIDDPTDRIKLVVLSLKAVTDTLVEHYGLHTLFTAPCRSLTARTQNSETRDEPDDMVHPSKLGGSVDENPKFLSSRSEGEGSAFKCHPVPSLLSTAEDPVPLEFVRLEQSDFHLQGGQLHTPSHYHANVSTGSLSAILSAEERRIRQKIAYPPYDVYHSILIETPEATSQEQYSSLSTILLHHWRFLYNVFLYYRALCLTTLSGIVYENLVRFLQDVELMEPLGSEALQRILQSITLAPVHPPDVAVPIHQFVEFLVRLLYEPRIMYFCRIDRRLPLATQFELFLTQFLLPRANMSDAIAFKVQMLQDTEMQTMLRRFDREIHTAFETRTTVESPSSQATRHAGMTQEEFRAYLDTMGANQSLGLEKDATLADNVFVHLVTGEENTMVEEDFRVALIAVALYQNPAPWCSPIHRVDLFLRSLFGNSARQTVRRRSQQQAVSPVALPNPRRMVPQTRRSVSSEGPKEPSKKNKKKR